MDETGQKEELLHAEFPAEAEGCGLLDAVQAAKGLDRGVVPTGKGTEGVTLADGVVLGGGCGLSLGLGLLGGLLLILRITFKDVDLLLLALWNVLAVGVQVLLLEDEKGGAGRWSGR